MGSRTSAETLNPLPPDPARHQLSAIPQGQLSRPCPFSRALRPCMTGLSLAVPPTVDCSREMSVMVILRLAAQHNATALGNDPLPTECESCAPLQKRWSRTGLGLSMVPWAGPSPMLRPKVKSLLGSAGHGAGSDEHPAGEVGASSCFA